MGTTSVGAAANPENATLLFFNPAGIGVFAPYGVAAEYNDDFVGRFLADETEAQGIAVQPTIAYKLDEQWSVGLGLMLLQAEGKLSKGQEYSAYTLPPYNAPAALL